MLGSDDAFARRSDNAFARRIDDVFAEAELPRGGASTREPRWGEEAEQKWNAVAKTLQMLPDGDEVGELFRRTEPVICLSSGVKRWPANVQWTPDRLVTHPERETLLRVAEDSSGSAVRLSIADMVSYCHVQRDPLPLYMFDHEFAERAPTLATEYDASIPVEISSGSSSQDYPRSSPSGKPSALFDLMSLMGEEHRPPFRWFAIGAQGSGCDVHQDPPLTCAWNALLHGRKRWALLHPSLMEEDVGVNDIIDDEPTAVWFVETLPKIAERHPGCVYVVDATPGSVIFVPPGWWHATWNVSTVSVAVTHNLVSFDAFVECWEHLREEYLQVRQRDDAAALQMQELDAQFAHQMMDGVVGAFGLVDREQAAGWLRAIAEYAAANGLEVPREVVSVAGWALPCVDRTH